MLDEHRPGITSTVSVGDDLKLEVAALASLLCGLVLYASIYMLLRSAQDSVHGLEQNTRVALTADLCPPIGDDTA